jgi:hypothetical protein
MSRANRIGRLVLTGAIGLMAAACGSSPPLAEQTAASESNLSWRYPAGTHSVFVHTPPYGLLK